MKASLTRPSRVHALNPPGYDTTQDNIVNLQIFETLLFLVMVMMMMATAISNRMSLFCFPRVNARSGGEVD